MTDLVRPRRALLSVSDKTGIVDLARALVAAGAELLSTGGTFKAIKDAGLPVTEVADYTGFPEMMDGRVKTLHPKIHGGLLGRRDLPTHVAAMKDHDIGEIDVVVVNLYPFEATVARGADFETCIENIDIGGPSMIRSAAKNHDFVAVMTDPADYAAFTVELTEKGGSTLATRRRLAAAAFSRTGSYDAAISAWFNGQIGETAPKSMAVGGAILQSLRYGENPHQQAAFYRTAENRPGVASAKQLQGKELSYNNINDTDAAFELVGELPEPAVAIIKHANPCGVAMAADLPTAYRKALACDPVSAFGGIIAVNRPLDAETAGLVAELFAEVVIAPSVTDEALAALESKKNLRVLVTGGLPDPKQAGTLVRSVAGGLLVQDRDIARATADTLETVTKRAPTSDEQRDLLLAFTLVKHVKSNAIVLVKDGASVGIGGGQTSRVDAARQAVQRAGEMATAAGESQSRAIGAVVASDAFFPFSDGLEVCLKAGVTAAIQPGGSKRDADVIATADAAGAAMVFTGLRHFKH
jgi:phosphoribosylaminoimidazolecarboxamide formyltransferase/IMP cyclohydrolase